MGSLCLALLLFVAPGSGASPQSDTPHADAGPRRAVEFDVAIDLAIDTPALAVRERATAQRRGLDGRITGTVSQPQILVQPGMRVLPGERRSLALQATVMQSWSLAGMGRARRTAARSETAEFAAQTRARRLAQRLAAARAWIDLHAVERQLELARHEAGLASSLVERSRVGFDGGVLGRDAVDRAEAYRSIAATRVVAFEGNAHDLGLVLARETASDPWRPLATAGAVPSPVLPDEPEIVARFAELERLPAVRARRLAQAAARAHAVEQARAARGTQITAGGQIDRDDPDGLLVYGIVGVSFAGRGAGMRAKGDAVLQRARLDADGIDEERALATTLATAVHELHHTREVLAHVDGVLVPALARSLETLSLQQGAGEGTVFEVLEARRRLGDAQIDRAAAEANVTWAEVHVWLLLAAIAEDAEP